jgi:hypothetical protein
MNFKEFLIESDVKDSLSNITKVFGEVLKKYTDRYEVKPHYFGNNGVTVQFWRSSKHEHGDYQVPAETLQVELEPYEMKYDLHLSDVYVPEEIRNKGYLTDALKEVRKLKTMSGRCKVHVAVNIAWKKIIERSGFEWL